MKFSRALSAKHHTTYLRTLSVMPIIAGLALILAVAKPSAHAQTYTVLYNFGSHSGDPTGPQYSGIIAQGRDGNFYSTAAAGGTGGNGAVFKITTSGALTVLHSFNGTDGQQSMSGLTLGTNGNLYGTTALGGLYSQGTIFKITAAGHFTSLYNFTGGSDGGNPGAPPVERMDDGNFYGTAPGVYEITRDGTFNQPSGLGGRTMFPSLDLSSNTYPNGPLVQGTDGNLYGESFYGGYYGDGFIFRTGRSDGRLLMYFGGYRGGNPFGPIIEGSDGNFYAASSSGGAGGAGVAFVVGPDGVDPGSFTALHNFTGGSDGGSVVGGLVQATDGNIYGTTSLGGTSGCGVLFRIRPSGAFDVLHDFDSVSGCHPEVTLLQHTNGKLYGDTVAGGSAGGGVFFSFDLGLAPFVRFLPDARQAGHTAELLGQGFTGTTSVSFNGSPATFTVASDTYLTATVPDGATSGFVTVTTPGGTLKSNRKFQIKPQLTSFSPASGPVGTTVVITGVSLAQTSAVMFIDGVPGCPNMRSCFVPASFTVNSDKQVTAIVPSGATSGHKIAIITTGAPVFSATTFAITP